MVASEYLQLDAGDALIAELGACVLTPLRDRPHVLAGLSNTGREAGGRRTARRRSLRMSGYRLKNPRLAIKLGGLAGGGSTSIVHV